MDLAFRHIILILLFIAVTNASAETQLMAEALRHFKIGDYVQTIETLKKVRGDKKIMGTKYYLMGISYNRIQEYDESVKAFKQSIANGSTTQDIWYEYGQALYAAN